MKRKSEEIGRDRRIKEEYDEGEEMLSWDFKNFSNYHYSAPFTGINFYSALVSFLDNKYCDHFKDWKGFLKRVIKSPFVPDEKNFYVVLKVLNEGKREMKIIEGLEY